MVMPSMHIRSMGFELPWRMLVHPDVFMLIAMYALPFGTFTMVSSSLSTIIFENYGFTTIEMGLCYIPLGIGSAVGSIVSGRVIDHDLAVHKKRYEKVQLHQARLNKQIWYNLAFSGFVIASAWVLDKKVHIAAAMVFQFFRALQLTSEHLLHHVFRHNVRLAQLTQKHLVGRFIPSARRISHGSAQYCPLLSRCSVRRCNAVSFRRNQRRLDICSIWFTHVRPAPAAPNSRTPLRRKVGAAAHGPFAVIVTCNITTMIILVSGV